jgi:hypothetical protein
MRPWAKLHASIEVQDAEPARRSREALLCSVFRERTRR